MGAYLVNALHQQPLLVLHAQPARLDNLGLEGKNHDRVLGRAGAHDPVAAGVELRAHEADVLAALQQDLRVGLQQVDALAGRDGQHGRERGREGVGGRRDALVLDHVLGARAEAAARAERAGQRADDHVHLGGVHVLRLRQASAGAPEHAKGPGLVEHEAELVLCLEFDLRVVSIASSRPRSEEPNTHQLGQVVDIAGHLKQCLGDDKAPRQLLAGLLLDDLAKDLLQILHVAMVVPLDAASRDLEAATDRVVDAPVRDDDVSSLAERRDDARDGRERVRVDDAPLSAQIRGDVGFGLHVHVLGAVELGRAAGTDAVGAEGLDGLLLDLLVGVEVVEVVRREVGDRLAVGKLRLRTRRAALVSFSSPPFPCQPAYLLPDKNWQLLLFCLLQGSRRRYQRLGRPFLNQLVDFLPQPHLISLMPFACSNPPSTELAPRLTSSVNLT